MAKLVFVLGGLTPLLTHNPISMVAKPGSGVSKKKVIPTPEDEAEIGTYRDAEGRFVFPVIGPRNALLVASKKYKVKGRRSSFFEDLSHVRPEEEYAVICNGKGKPAKSYSIDSRRVVIQRNGVIRSRPKFELPWSITFSLIYDDQLISDPEIVRTIMQDAGNRIGIGDYRPARWGWFGRFEVLSMEVVA